MIEFLHQRSHNFLQKLTQLHQLCNLMNFSLSQSQPPFRLSKMSLHFHWPRTKRQLLPFPLNLSRSTPQKCVNHKRMKKTWKIVQKKPIHHLLLSIHPAMHTYTLRTFIVKQCSILPSFIHSKRTEKKRENKSTGSSTHSATKINSNSSTQKCIVLIKCMKFHSWLHCFLCHTLIVLSQLSRFFLLLLDSFYQFTLNVCVCVFWEVRLLKIRLNWQSWKSRLSSTFG